jgi:predicted NBD/HSP70 family sugar kinase
LAEGRQGAAKDVGSYVWVYIGTGIAAGIVNNGQLLRGWRGFGGELGQCRVGVNGRILEDLASQRAIDQELLALGDDKEKSEAAIRRACDYIGLGVSYLANVLNPELVVLSGKLFENTPFALEATRETARAHCLAPDSTRIVLSTLGERAAINGAVLLATDQASTRKIEHAVLMASKSVM